MTNVMNVLNRHSAEWIAKYGPDNEMTLTRNAVAELIEALQAVLPRIAHDAICASVRPSHEWAEHGSITFDNCCCGINQVKSALAKASP